ncbi:hypothetical protein B296_00039191 [Ensete ventricosum]|uniref:Uncharacterized protein n=1 Tax=Ensete ventricosum TaxID=4639 RepID=A0A426ZNM8_ENSVE|nr:hypothetical protein B296_00039191 [Ensete ventricosum]
MTPTEIREVVEEDIVAPEIPQRRRKVQCRRFVSHCGNREEFNAAVSDILQLSEKGRVGGRKFKWLRGLLTMAEAGSIAVGGNNGGRGRWTSVRDCFVKEEQQIWFGIARLDAQAAVKAGLSWPRLPPGRIRRCGCPRGELGVAVIDLEVIGAFAAFRRFSPLAAIANPL